MDFLRRMFGHSTNSNATPLPRNDVVTITNDASAVKGPPEAVVDVTQVELPAPNTDNIDLSETLKPAPPSDAELAGTRPLPPLETVVFQPGQRLTFGQLSDVGMVRGNNQDSMFSLLASGSSVDNLPDFGLFIVADGMGGHHDGEKASAITTRIVAMYLLNNLYMALLNQNMDDPERPTITDILRDAVQHANEAVTEEIPEGGTTATVAVVLGDLAYVAHVGDSRAYLIADDGIEQITRDHSLVQRLIELDQLTPEEAAEYPQRNVLYRAIGQNDNLDVDVITRRLSPRSRLLLCSDGLWNLVPEDTIRSEISAHPNPQEACSLLVRMANDRGGHDNITVILVQIPG
jgi:protein phosphatase